jgi:hypothetical protein
LHDSLQYAATRIFGTGLLGFDNYNNDDDDDDDTTITTRAIRLRGIRYAWMLEQIFPNGIATVVFLTEGGQIISDSGFMVDGELGLVSPNRSAVD